jgi:hypothetical protein
MVLSLLGSAGIGVVWGWLIGSLYGRIHDPQRTVPAVIIGTIPVILEVAVLEGLPAVIVLLGACALALGIHISWRRQLYRRFGWLNENSSGG